VPYRDEPWRGKYPQLLTYLEGNYAEPRGNLVTRNLCWGGSWDEIEGKARPGVKLENNLVGEDPRFVDPAKEDFRLKPDSPAWKLGFERIPLERIGLYKDELRASWPVKTTVRPPANPQTATGAKPTARRPGPTFAVAKAAVDVAVDGTLTAAEWGGLDPKRAMPIAQGLEEEKVSPSSQAWLFHDGKHLLVAVDNQVDPAKPLRPGDTWGSDDAVELAFRSPVPGNPLLILRGYPSGHFASSDEAGAPPEAVKRAAQSVEYAARVVDAGRWTAEWRIPLASLGIDPVKHPRFAFSLAVRKTGGPEWVLWVGTHHATWQVDDAGFLELR
jgi:hypothetical protein